MGRFYLRGGIWVQQLPANFREERSRWDLIECPPVTNGFKIQPANDSAACRDRFNEIVNEAIGCAAAEGYEISHHESSRDSRGWGIAVFSKID
jgi:hypothetical protein